MKTILACVLLPILLVTNSIHAALIARYQMGANDTRNMAGSGFHALENTTLPFADRFGSANGASLFLSELNFLRLDSNLLNSAVVTNSAVTISLWFQVYTLLTNLNDIPIGANIVEYLDPTNVESHDNDPGKGGAIHFLVGRGPDRVEGTNETNFDIALGDFSGHYHGELFGFAGGIRPSDERPLIAGVTTSQLSMIAKGFWHHLAIVVTPTAVTFVLDGVEYSPTLFGPALRDLLPFAAQTLTLGGPGSALGTPDQAAKGRYVFALDDVRLYDSALSGEEVRSLMNEPSLEIRPSVTLLIASREGKLVIVEYTEDPVSGRWVTAHEFIATSIPTTWTDTNPNSPQRYYRVRVN